MVNTHGTIAPLRNVALFTELVERVLHRRDGLPGMACFSGFSGYGKTRAAAYATNKYRAYHVQMQSCWTRRTLCESIMLDMALAPEKSMRIDRMIAVIGKQLALSRRPLIIDEADYLMRNSAVELTMDMYEASGAPVILIGEEKLPEKLLRWERVHGRMLDWVQAQPASLGDARHLAKLYCPGIEIADDLIDAVHRESNGSARRIVVNLNGVREQAELGALKRIALGQFKGQLFTGESPMPRHRSVARAA